MLQYSSENIKCISDQITHLFGLQFPPNRETDLMRAVKSAAQVFNIGLNEVQLLQWLCNKRLSKEEISELSETLTINETYFFREKTALELISEKVIPAIIRDRNINEFPIRIWSAGCSSGEEPYSIAMWLYDHFPELNTKNLTILATDISPLAIKKGLIGEYSEWSFRETSGNTRQKYFCKQGNKNIINNEIKKTVSFSFLNLSKNSYPSSTTNTEQFDVIFCRNVLMYFSPQVIKEVSARFFKALTNTGWFISSQVELNDEYFGNFKRVTYKNGIFYTKPTILQPKEVQFTNLNMEIQEITNCQSFKTKVKKNQTKTLDSDAKKQNNPINANLHINKTEPVISTQVDFKINYEFNFAKVKELSNSGNYRASIELIHKLLCAYPQNADLYYLYANILYEINELEQVEVLLNKTLYLNHTHLDAALLMAYTLKKRKKEEQSIRYFKQAVSIISEECIAKKSEAKIDYDRLLTTVKHEIELINNQTFH